MAASKKQSISWQERNRLEKEAIETFLSTRKALAKKLRVQAERLKKLEADAEAIRANFKAVGLYTNFEDYYPDQFVASGGMLPIFDIGSLNYDWIIAELVAAPAADRAIILTKYGIVWE